MKEKSKRVVNFAFSCYACPMSITQTVDIPDNHKLTIDVPSEVPTGPAVLTFTPAPKRKLTAEEEVEYFKQNADWLNKQAEETLEFQDLDAFEEDLKRLTPQMIAVLRDTVVPINLAELIANRDDEQTKDSSKKGSSL